MRIRELMEQRGVQIADAHADRRLMQIAEDNIIAPDERPEF